MRIAGIALVAALAACSAVPEKPVDQAPTQPVIAVRQVEVGVREKCTVTLPSEPIWATEAIDPGASKLEKSKAALIELEQRRKYAVKVKAEASRCN